MPVTRNSSHPGKNTPSWSLIIYVLGLVVFFFGFTDLTRVTDTSLTLFYAFLALLSVGVLLAVHHERPTV